MLKAFSARNGKGRPADRSSGKSRRAGSPSLIGADMRIQGQIDTVSAVTIAGTVVGNVQSESQVTVAESGKVEGDICAPEVVVGGKVNGSIIATQRTELHTTSLIDGDITTNQLLVHEGGQVNGRLQTGSGATASIRGEEPRHLLKIPAGNIAAAV